MTKAMKVLAMVLVATFLVAPVVKVEAATSNDGMCALFEDKYLLNVYRGEVRLAIDNEDHSDTDVYQLTKPLVAKSAYFAEDGMVYVWFLSGNLYFTTPEKHELELWEREVTDVQTSGDGMEIRIVSYSTKRGIQPLVTVEEWEMIEKMSETEKTTETNIVNSETKTTETNESTSNGEGVTIVIPDRETEKETETNIVNSETKTTETNIVNSETKTTETTVINSETNCDSSDSALKKEETKNVTINNYYVIEGKNSSTATTTKNKTAVKKKTAKTKVKVKSSTKTVKVFYKNGSKKATATLTKKTLKYKGKKYKKVTKFYFNRKGTILFLDSKGILRKVTLNGKHKKVAKKVTGFVYEKNSLLAIKYILKSGKKVNAKNL